MFALITLVVYYAPETRTYKVLLERDALDSPKSKVTDKQTEVLRGNSQLVHRVDEHSASLSDVLPGRHSDPFNAQGIPINPRINQLLTFIRDAYLPGIYITSFMKRSGLVSPTITTFAEGFKLSGKRRANSVWTSMKEELTDEGRALAWIASYIPVLSRYSSPEVARELALMAIDMKVKSMRILKNKIASLQTDEQPDIALLAQIVSLFRASCKEGDLESANVHARIIRCLIDRMHEGSDQMRTLFITLLSNDTEVAVSNMRHTFFEFDNWVQKQLQKFWWSAKIFKLPPVSQQYTELHCSIRVSHNRTACIRLRRYLIFRKMKMNLEDPKDLEYSDGVFSWVSTYSMYDLGLLVGVYLDLLEGKVYDDPPAIRFAEASIALTTLYLYRWGVHQATIMEVTIVMECT